MVTLRAQVPNPDEVLLPGMFARARLEQAVENQAVTVPQRAVMRGASGAASVLVVTSDNKVEPRVIQTGATHGDKWVVSSGLKAGERVIVEGTLKAPPGSTVVPVPFQEPGAKTVGQANQVAYCRSLILGKLIMARFFIDRPVFAWVISLLIMLLGVLAITRLPVAQYPSIAPPAIAVSAFYAGASRKRCKTP